jgi:hypothetical protein
VEITAAILGQARCYSFNDRYIPGRLIDSVKCTLIWYLGTQKSGILGIEVPGCLGSQISGVFMARIESTSRAIASQLDLLPQKENDHLVPTRFV